MTKNVLILKAGTVAHAVRLGAGDYDRWFLRALGSGGRRFQVVQADQRERLPPRVRDYQAMIVTGSPSSMAEPEDWMLRLGEYLREAAEQRVAVLGVCFGHQVLGHVFGAKVRRSPRGREIGTVTCELTAAGRGDPLFDGIPARFDVQATHEDAVEESPREMEILATNAHSGNQAFRVGEYVRAVQFHPEVDAATMRALIESRVAKLEAEAAARGEEPTARVRALLAGIRPTPFGTKILENFLSHFS
jgi:GMP synthase (glutamine-hydrolysing)